MLELSRKMDDYIFEVIDKRNRKIRLTRRQWQHIREDHPDVTNHEDIENTIKNPIKTLHLEKSKIVYFRYFKHRRDAAKYLKVIGKYLNGSGFVITAYFVKTIK